MLKRTKTDRFAAIVFWFCCAPVAAEAPQESEFKVPDDLRFELVLSEPQVRQPVHISFDERGRMWIVQYLQYPEPAGLKLLSHDSFWRSQYDKVPPPPPRHFRGADKISIFEDKDGDGAFESEKTFVEGLSIATSVCRGRGGVWVTNPPYLLFYPDRNDDDVPDGDPEVHLEGFGVEDTHSVINSLCWGPDGWLYAAQGSTVTGDVKRPGSPAPPVHSLGQLIWRYHPELKQYEVFAEGGGNAFGVEFDSAGRIYSGYNGGNTRGFHYVQGGYFQKGFEKHGPLSNPFTFGYFPAMKHNEVQRFTHTFVVYDGQDLPERYNGKLFGVAPLLHHVVMSKIDPDGSTFQTRDIGYAAESNDPRFIPVDIKQGPDGALYVADWRDDQCAHFLSYQGKIDKSNGRVYRLRAANATPRKSEDLSQLSSGELVERLKHRNKWQRQTALRLLGDRRDASVAPVLRQQLRDDVGQASLEALWALYQIGCLDEPTRLAALDHANPQVRLWAVRLMCDPGNVSATESDGLQRLARKEHDSEVCCQIASSARRLPTNACLQISRSLIGSQRADDSRLPLLVWWAIEAKIASDSSAVIDLFRDPAFWRTPIVQRDIAERLMRRFAATDHRADLSRCAELLRLAPADDDVKRLMAGFEAAYAGRSMPELPNDLAAALERYSGTSVVLGLRQGRSESLEAALKLLEDDQADKTKQLQYVQVLGEVSQPSCIPILMRLANGSPDNALQTAALRALGRYDDARIAPAVIDSLPKMSDDVRAAAIGLLMQRASSTLALLRAIDAERIERASLPTDVMQHASLFAHSEIKRLVEKLWPDSRPATSEEFNSEIRRISDVLESGIGEPKSGKAIFAQQCSKCHRLFGEGGDVGPDLTAFNRNDIRAMLLSIVHPSAEIREGYNSHVIVTSDGRALTGTLADQDPQTIRLRAVDGASLSISRTEIEDLTISNKSIMPEGLLKGLGDRELRDFFAYLRMTQPLIDR